MNEHVVGDYSGIIKDEEFIPDRRPAAHHHRKNEQQHQNMRNRLEQCPAIAKLGIAEPGARLSDDQSVNHAAWVRSVAKNSGVGRTPWRARSVRSPSTTYSPSTVSNRRFNTWSTACAYSWFS